MGSLGDLHPMIALGLGLRDRGHNVVFGTHKEYRSKIESLGFEFHALRPDNPALEDAEIMARMMDAQKGTEHVIRDWIFASLRDTYTDLVSIARNVDFIIASEAVVAARLVAEKLGMKWAFCALSPASFCSAYDPPVLPIFSILSKFRPLGLSVNRGVMNFARLVTRSWVQPMYQLRQELGLPSVGHPIFEGKYSPYLVLALFSAVLAKPQPDWAANSVITGFALYDGKEETQLPAELQHFLNAGEPPIVFTLGSAAVFDPGTFYLESIQAAQQLNRRAVLLIGSNPPPKDLPESIIAVDYVPYSEIFPRACAIVHQGGIGTTAQALRAGHPTLVVPYSHDQPDNAARAERLGTARTVLRQSYIARRAVKELSQLLDNPSYTAKATEIRHLVQAEDGVRLACDEIEKQLSIPSVR